jgi:hypothetical protein
MHILETKPEPHRERVRDARYPGQGPDRGECAAQKGVSSWSHGFLGLLPLWGKPKAEGPFVAGDEGKTPLGMDRRLCAHGYNTMGPPSCTNLEVMPCGWELEF